MHVAARRKVPSLSTSTRLEPASFSLLIPGPCIPAPARSVLQPWWDRSRRRTGLSAPFQQLNNLVHPTWCDFLVLVRGSKDSLHSFVSFLDLLPGERGIPTHVYRW